VQAQEPRADGSEPPQPRPPQTQQPSEPAPTPRVDVSQLPLDLERLQRKLQQAVEREERQAATLRYRIDVVGIAPRIQIFTPDDNLVFGRAPYGAPTHREMMNIVTPREFRTPIIGLGTISW
jgi:hypothetical protein